MKKEYRVSMGWRGGRRRWWRHTDAQVAITGVYSPFWQVL